MRTTIFALCAGSVLIYLYVAYQATLQNSDPSGETMALVFNTVLGIVVLLPVVPAMLMAIAKSALPLALLLALVVPVAAGFTYLRLGLGA